MRASILISLIPFATPLTIAPHSPLSNRQRLTPSGRRGKGKAVYAVDLAPKPPTNPTESLLIQGGMGRLSEGLEGAGMATVDLNFVRPGEDGYPVDLGGLVGAREGTGLDDGCLLFVRVGEEGKDEVREKSGEVSDLVDGLAVPVGRTDIFEVALEMGLGVIAICGKADGLDATSELSTLPGEPSDYLSAVVVDGDPGDVPDDDADPDEYKEFMAGLETLPLPPKPFDKIPVFVTSTTPAGSGRLQNACAALKKRGYAGIYLDRQTVPPGQSNNCEKLGGFWGIAVRTLKMNRSTTFGGFRSKVVLAAKDDVPLQWYNYQKSIMADGSLGKSPLSEASMAANEDPLDTAKGDYKGF